MNQNNLTSAQVIAKIQAGDIFKIKDQESKYDIYQYSTFTTWDEKQGEAIGKGATYLPNFDSYVNVEAFKGQYILVYTILFTKPIFHKLKYSDIEFIN